MLFKMQSEEMYSNITPSKNLNCKPNFTNVQNQFKSYRLIFSCLFVLQNVRRHLRKRRFMPL